MNLLKSTVKKALIKHYEEKYSSDKNKDEKIKKHLKEVVAPETGGSWNQDVPGPERGYNITGKVSNVSIGDLIDESGYRLVYDSFTEGLEPIYFWIVDWMKDNYWGVGLEISKTMDQFEASVGSGYFGDMGTRASIMQDRAMKLLGTINTVTRSVINLLYDLKEFDQRLQLYKDLQSGDESKKDAAKLGLKQFWMDKVDVQRGRGSLNLLAQQLQFVTLRDAFMAANNEEDVEKLDLNDRVKRILKPRINDYLTWERLSAKELERRYRIEKNYLKSQIDALKLYGQWAKPYFQAASKLQQDVGSSPNLVSTFNTLQVQTSILGTKREGEYFTAVEVTFDFRSIPHTMRQSQAGVHYTQGGKVEIQIRAFGLNEEEKKAVDEYELYETLDMAGVNADMIKEIEDAVKDYFTDEDSEFTDPVERLGFLQELVEKTPDKDVRKNLIKEIEDLKKTAKGKKNPGPFEALFGSFKEFPGMFNFKKKKKPGSRGKAIGQASFFAYLVYNVYKKSHGMYTE